MLIATYNRPEHLRTCLEHLDRQSVAPAQIIVVDSSEDDRSAEEVRRHGGVTYLRNPAGRGHTATSRRIGVAAVRSDIEVIAFIDDDAYADPDWLEQLISRYDDPRVGAVGGRASNGIAGEEAEGWDAIGRFLPDATLTGNFAADPGHDVDVDHLLGANMSLRRSVLHAVGGIQDYYPGTCLREESEIALRIGLAGFRLVYTPAARVLHVAGPYARGRRFDARYSYYGQRNHIVLVGRVLGRRDPRFRRYLGVALRQVRSELAYAVRSFGRRRILGPESISSGLGRGMTRAVSAAAGIATGLALVLSGRVPRAQVSAEPAPVPRP